jgi:hypothetical protein
MQKETSGMNDDLRAVLQAYLEACEGELKPKLEEWIEKHPRYREDLVQFAVYSHVVDWTAPIGEREQTPVDDALDIEWEAFEEAFGTLPDPAPLPGIVARARELHLSVEAVAVSLSLAVDILLKLERRVLVLNSIPATLLERLATSLYCSVAALRAFLAGPPPQPATTFYHAKQPPTQEGQQTFEEAVRESRMMSAEQKEMWLRAVAQGAVDG